jgi:hypothetical protein
MRRAILFLLVAVAFCSSCKKDQKKDFVLPAKTYKVNFNVADFTQTLVGNSANNLHTDGLKTNTTPPLSSVIDEIDYYVFNSAGVLKHYLKQQSTVTNFGTITDALPAGTYTVVFAAGKTGLYVFQNGLTNSWLEGYGTHDPLLPWQDTFFKKISLTVGDADINQSVALDRIVSQLTVNIEDVIPANAYSIKITARTYTQFFFDTGSIIKAGTNNTPNDNFAATIVIPASAKGTTNYKASISTLNTDAPSTVVIGCYDSAGNALASVSVNNVIVHTNTQTILSGQLFGTNNLFGITVNSKWDTINSSF